MELKENLDKIKKPHDIKFTKVDAIKRIAERVDEFKSGEYHTRGKNVFDFIDDLDYIIKKSNVKIDKKLPNKYPSEENTYSVIYPENFLERFYYTIDYSEDDVNKDNPKKFLIQKYHVGNQTYEEILEDDDIPEGFNNRKEFDEFLLQNQLEYK